MSGFEEYHVHFIILRDVFPLPNQPLPHRTVIREREREFGTKGLRAKWERDLQSSQWGLLYTVLVRVGNPDLC